MSEKETRKPPFGLDMPFEEALERFGRTDPREAAAMEAAEAEPGEEKATDVLTWTKKLSKTDAQQETTGGLVPYLRLTKSSLTDEDFQTWFREEFFAGCAWVPGHYGKEAVETATVAVDVSVKDIAIGKEMLTVTHGENRKDKHNTPNTWVHWSPKLQQILELNDFTDQPVRLTREDSGLIRLDIQAAADTDEG